MKNLILFSLTALVILSACKSTKPAARSLPASAADTAVAIDTATVMADTVAAAPVMKNALDSFSYALGISMASFYREQGVEDINTELVSQALSDVKSGSTKMQEADVNNTIINYMQTAKSSKAEPNKKLSQAFLDSNKAKPGVVSLPSGLQYQVLTKGTGPKPALTDKVKVHYEGSLINGKIFDSSIERGEPIELNVNGVIPGWTEALQLMPKGSKWKLFIPSDLAYGDNGAGADIKPGDALIFTVELLDIVK